MAVAFDGSAQRRVTPVRSAEPGTTVTADEPEGPDLTHVVHMHDAQGNAILVDTITGREVPDTTGLLAAPPKMEQPLLYEASAGVNLWDAAMRAFGQSYGLGDVWGELNLHNRYLVSLTAGVGEANIAPDDKNFTFRTPVSPYFKIGAAYNFLYNSNPDYKLMIGARYGFSPFRWRLENVTVDDSYWQDPSTYSLPEQSHTTGWLEITFGLRVRIAGAVSVGWNIIYQAILHDSSSPYGQPMYIPGFGKRSNPLAASLSVSYTFPLASRKKTRAAAAPEPDALAEPASADGSDEETDTSDEATADAPSDSPLIQESSQPSEIQ